MAVALECINLIIPIALIEKKHPGGWQAYLDEHPGLPSEWYDQHLLRLGAMNSLDIQLLVDAWKEKGFKPFKTINGIKHWQDMCVVDTFSGPTLPCAWLEFDADQRTASYKTSELFNDAIVKALATELSKWKSDDELAKLYQWPIEKQIENLPDEFKPLGELVNQKTNTLEKTLCLRRELKGSQKFSFPLSKWIIECWGGITTGKDDDSLMKCLAKADNKNFDFDRIASWSKHVAFKHPEEYAIYDARVIYSLNWLLFKTGASKYFPAPSGRNSVMELLDYHILLFIGHYKVEGVEKQLNEDIEERNKTPGKKSFLAKKLKREIFIGQSDAFTEYCNLLKRIAAELYNHDKTDLSLTKVEMMLFSLADKYIALDVFRDFSKILPQGDGSVSHAL